MRLKSGTSSSDLERVEENLAPVPAVATIDPFLRALSELRGSDLHIKVGSPARVRIDGRLRKLQA